MTPAATIRPLRAPELEGAAEVLARAFHDDPGARIIEPDDDRRDLATRELFAPVVRWAIAFGHVAASELDGRVVGVATFLPPGHDTPSDEELIAAGLLDAVGAVPEAAGRMGPMVEFLEGLHARSISGPHWRLEFFGVDPAFQGTGLGSRLIETGHAKADAAGDRIYLETFTPQNVRWYEARGYRVVEEVPMPGSPYTVWGLIRDPRPR